MKKKVLLLILLLLMLFGCSNSNDKQKYYNVDELNNKVIAIWSGCGYEDYVDNRLDGTNFVYGELSTDLFNLVKNNKADAFVIGETFYRYHSSEVDGITILNEPIGKARIAAIVSDNEMGKEILSKFNEFVAKIDETGEIDEYLDKWTNPQNNPEVDFSELDESNPVVNIGYALEEPPYSYKQNNKQYGIDVDLFVSFCKEYGYYPNFVDSTYEAVVTLIQTKQLDIGMAGYNIVESKREAITYSDPYITENVIVGVKSPTSQGNIFKKIGRSFYRSFIENDRYLEYINGAGVTLYITLFVVIIGTILGFLLYLLYINGLKFIEKIVNAIDFVLGRIPEIVLLMFLFYVVFAQSSLTSKTIAAITLCFIFTVNIFKDIELAVSSIDKNQREAASSLGFNNTEIFIHIIFPQVFELFMANYENEIIQMMLETSVSGYISVVDLTKAGDIIRNTTYESFLPLIIVAVFYFVVSTIIIKIISIIRKRADYKARTQEYIMKQIEKNALFKKR